MIDKKNTFPPRMPTLKALQVLECVARTKSFKNAANELCVTPAAVSFQIRQLEKDLDTHLFERTSTGVIPTQAATAFLPKLSAGIEMLYGSFGDFLSIFHEAPKPVRITSGPAVMSKWLVPQVQHLKRRRPNIEVEFTAGLGLADLVRDNIDFAIRFGSQPDDRYVVEEIAEEYLIPAISPRLADQVHSPDDLTRFDLIHDRSLQQFNKTAPSWETWFQKVGLRYDSQRLGVSFSQSDHAVQASASGAGVGLVRVILAGPELLSGALKIPFGPAIPTGLRYYLVATNPKPQTDEKAEVGNWLKEDIAQTFRGLIRRFCTKPDDDSQRQYDKSVGIDDSTYTKKL